MDSLIQVHNLSFKYTYSQIPVLKNINLLINEGEYVAVIGPNGCGKTTLIRHFNALLLPTTGHVQVNGLNTRDAKNHIEIRRQVGMIFQNPDHQIVAMSVEEDVAFGPGNLGLPAREIRQRVDRALSMVGLTGLESRPPHSLSGGQKQLLAIAGLLVMEPKIIVLDEPTSSLDPEGKKRILNLLRNLQSRGIGIIHVTHNMNEAALADRILVMDQGELMADGSPAEILCRVDWLKTLGLDPPQITELMWQLQQEGEDVTGSIFTAETAAKEILALLDRARGKSHV